MPDILQEQLDTVLILQSMYPLTSELLLGPATETYLQALSTTPPSHFDLSLTISPENDPSHPITLQITLSTSSNSSSSPTFALYPHNTIITPRQPAWLPRSAYPELQSLIPHQNPEESSIDYILSTIDHLKTRITLLIPLTNAPLSLPRIEPDEELQRVWFWFPSLSTREKRKDLVDYAPRYNLTGFVLAGKPGLLCLEGDSRQVDKYMSAIKSESWSDIPSYQKKVTERFRKPIPSGTRAFSDMKEITHLIPTYGQYNHRGEMGEVRRLMDEWGIGEDFGVVVMNAGS